MRKYLPLLAPIFLLGGCKILNSAPQVPSTLAETNSPNTYIPIDPIPVLTTPAKSCAGKSMSELLSISNASKGMAVLESLPEAFPDNTVRVAHKAYYSDGTVSFGPISSAQIGQRYQIVIDYINADQVNQTFFVRKNAVRKIDNKIEYFGAFRYLSPDEYIIPETSYSVSLLNSKDKLDRKNFESVPDGNNINVGTNVNVPVYVGVGLRVIADIVTVEGDTNISGLGAISAAAESGAISGSLVVQTLGINGKSITAAMPIQSDLNPTTIQNAIVAIGSIKALMYSEETTLKPRIVGIYNPIGGGDSTVNSLLSEMSSGTTEWRHPCVRVKFNSL